MTIPAPLHIDKDGKLHSPDGAIKISFSQPFPIPFSRGGVTGKVKGNLLHTTDCTFQEAVNTFQSPDAQGSAHLLVGTIGIHDGELMQFVPLGKGYETFHAFDANIDHYGTETEDGGSPHTPISDKGLWTWGLVEEFLSRFAGYHLQVLVNETGEGLGYHRQFPNWNKSNHSCPGASFTDMVRVNQRVTIVDRARQIRAAATTPDPGPFPSGLHIMDGTGSLRGFAQRQGIGWTDVWFRTAVGMSALGENQFGPLQDGYMKLKDPDATAPSGMRVWS